MIGVDLLSTILSEMYDFDDRILEKDIKTWRRRTNILRRDSTVGTMLST